MAWYWTAWWFLLFVSFGVGEAYAVARNKMTLSRYMWTLSKRFPLLPFLVGALIGGLAVHFWWGGIVCFETVK